MAQCEITLAYTELPPELQMVPEDEASQTALIGWYALLQQMLPAADLLHYFRGTSCDGKRGKKNSTVLQCHCVPYFFNDSTCKTLSIVQVLTAYQEMQSEWKWENIAQDDIVYNMKKGRKFLIIRSSDSSIDQLS